MKKWFNKQAEKAKETTEKLRHKATQKQTKSFQGRGHALGSTTGDEAASSAAERRAQQLRAAESRGKAWDNKIAKGRENRKEPEQQSDLGMTTLNAKTAIESTVPAAAPVSISFEESKAAEASAIEQSGFNP